MARCYLQSLEPTEIFMILARGVLGDARLRSYNKLLRLPAVKFQRVGEAECELTDAYGYNFEGMFYIYISHFFLFFFFARGGWTHSHGWQSAKIAGQQPTCCMALIAPWESTAGARQPLRNTLVCTNRYACTVHPRCSLDTGFLSVNEYSSDTNIFYNIRLLPWERCVSIDSVVTIVRALDKFRADEIERLSRPKNATMYSQTCKKYLDTKYI